MLARVALRPTRSTYQGNKGLLFRFYATNVLNNGAKSTPKQVYELWRKDDHGNVVYMATYSNPEEASRMCEVFEKRGHRQVYWVEKKDEVADVTQRRFR